MSSLKIIGQEPVAVNIPKNQEPYNGKVAIVTLGCAKNQVDSEVMLGVLKSKGFEIVSEVEESDIAIVNTCSFLESAVKESIDCILDISELKTTGRLKKLIVSGCLVSRYGSELRETLPEADAFVSLNDILQVGEVSTGVLSDLFDQGGRPYFLYDDTMPRQISDSQISAYVKISEGCNRPCAFCIIPKIRGTLRTREPESIVKEITELSRQGVREVNLVAQDLTAYGSDHKLGNLSDLLKRIDQTGIDWVRLLYSYPVGIDAELMNSIKNLKSVCNYLDLPLQHASEKLLKAMKRPVGKFAAKNISDFIMNAFPEIAFRTTFIVGLPGETEEDVQELEDLILKGYYSSVGIFTYSPERGTPAAEMPNQVAQKLKEQRRNRLMAAQQTIVDRRNQSLIGKTFNVLLEGPHPDTDLVLRGRTEFQAPDVDGLVIINDSEYEDMSKLIGNFIPVEITEISGYDLVGKIKSM